MSLVPELQRRNVIRVATAYVVAAWLIIQIAETTFPVFGFSDNAIRVVIIVLGIGLVPAIVGAWVFQLTPQGLRRDKGAGETPATSKIASRNLDRAIIVTLVLGLIYFAVDKFVLAPDRAAEREAEVAEQARAEAIVGFYGDRSIAVLPFTNMSSDPEQEYFVDGIAEEVLNLLSRIRELRVISRSSAFAFRGQDLEIREIAKRLDVAHVLEGSVRKIGNTVRVTAQLIDARTDTHLWSHTYERELENVFAIQDEIAADVARNLQIELLRPLPHSVYVDPEVVSLTQQAKQLSEMGVDGVGIKMHTLLSRALDLDPDYVPALKWLVSSDFFRWDEGLLSYAEKEERYEWIKARILEADPGNGFVDAVEAWTLAENGEFEKAAALYSRSLSRDLTDSNAVSLAASFIRRLGRLDTAIQLYKHAVAIDPLCFMCIYQLSRTYFYAGDYELALAARERFLAIGTGGMYHYGLMLLLQGEAQAALDYYLVQQDDRSQMIAGRAMASYALGDVEGAELELERLQAMSDGGDDLDLLADVAAWMGRSDRAFELLNEIAVANTGAAQRLTSVPLFRALHNDPRWDAWLDSIGMSAERLDAIEFNPNLPE